MITLKQTNKPQLHSYEINLKYKDTGRLKIKPCRKKQHANITHENGRVLLLSDKVDFMALLDIKNVCQLLIYCLSAPKGALILEPHSADPISFLPAGWCPCQQWHWRNTARLQEEEGASLLVPCFVQQQVGGLQGSRQH